MDLMARLTKIEQGFGRLDASDSCWHIGEFQSHGGWSAGETNQQIKNLKIEVPVPPNRKRYKDEAVRYWGGKLAECLSADAIRRDVTFVPAPCSKPVGHAEYDDRIRRVLDDLAGRIGVLDIRELVVTHTERQAQHKGEHRSSPAELLQTLRLNPAALQLPLRPIVLILDDVFTQGSTFRALKTLITPVHGVQEVGGIFLARTVWPKPPEIVLPVF
ncbi:hypothetical protein [Lysobacter firmicutimachus]|uniref:Phosphoribosyltransferase n=1 Tax=Lysobacter firmicutimachus TaxID=1792846 RepID=A0ABU8D0L6_9GAMM